LSGLKKIHDYHQQGKDLSLLLTGKVSIEFVDIIEYMIAQGYAVKGNYYTDSFLENKNTNKTVNFILNNLK
jgi:hypothetical protein